MSERELDFEPVIEAIDSASGAELDELAKIGSVLQDVCSALKQQDVNVTSNSASDMQIKRVKRPSDKGADSRQAETTKEKNGSQSNANSDTRNHHRVNPSVANRVSNETVTDENTVINHIVNSNDENSVLKDTSKSKNNENNHSATSFARNKANGITLKDISVNPNAGGQSGDTEGQADKQASNLDAVTEAMKELKGFYRDQRGRLRRPDGRFASKEQRAKYSASEQANKEAEERRKGKQAGEPEQKSAIKKIVDALQFISNKGKGAGDNEATEVAGAAAGNSYWKAAVEGYQLIENTKELVDEKLEKRADKKKAKSEQKPENANTTGAEVTPIGKPNQAGVITQIKPLDNGASERVGQASAVSRTQASLTPPAGGKSGKNTRGQAGSLSAKSRATAAANVKKTQEQTQTIKDNHTETMEVLEDLLDEIKGGKKSGGGIIGKLLGGAAGKGGLSDLVTGGIGYGLYKKWKKRRADKKAAKAAKKAKKARALNGEQDDGADLSDLDLDFDREREHGKGKRGRRSRRARSKRYGRKRVRGRRKGLSRLFNLGEEALELGEEAGTAKNALSTGRKAAKAGGKAAGAITREAGGVAARAGGQVAGKAAGSMAAKAGGKAAGAVAKGAMVAGEAAEGAGVLGSLGSLGGKGAGKMLKGGVKLLGGAAKILGPLGMVASAGMSYADEEGQRAAFGLKDGEEVGTQKKLAYTAVDSLSMGGLLFDASKMAGKGLAAMGFDKVGKDLQDFDEGDAAQALDKGVTSLTDSFKSLFSDAKEKVNAASVALTGKPILNMATGNQNEGLKGGVGADVADRRLSQYDKEFEAAGKQYGVSPALLKAMAKQESGGNPYAVSKAGAAGLMQFTKGTAGDVGITDRFDPQQSIHGGAKYMAQLLKRYNGDEKMALSAYNFGMGSVDNAMKATGGRTFEEIYSALPAETKNYAPAILAQRKRYAAEAAPEAAQQAKPVTPTATTATATEGAKVAPQDAQQVTTTQTAEPVTQKASQTKAIVAVPSIVPTTMDIGATASARAGDSPDKTIDVVAKTDPALINSMNNGFNKLAKALDGSGQSGKPAPSSQPAPRPKVPRSSGDAEVDSYMRDGY